MIQELYYNLWLYSGSVGATSGEYWPSGLGTSMLVLEDSELIGSWGAGTIRATLIVFGGDPRTIPCVTLEDMWFQGYNLRCCFPPGVFLKWKHMAWCKISVFSGAWGKWNGNKLEFSKKKIHLVMPHKLRKRRRTKKQVDGTRGK